MSKVENRKSKAFGPRPSAVRRAFTLIEVMVVVTLLSFIVIALMGVFNSTQAAFRASITQTDVLESGRAAMDMIAEDLKEMSPAAGNTNLFFCPVNFYADANAYQYGSQAAPLLQSLIGVSNPTIQRTNVLEKIFILSRDNRTWTGTGYVVDTTATSSLNPLYRFSMSTNMSVANGPWMLFTNFINSSPPFTSSPPWSHLMDGVVTLRVRAYDPSGLWLTNGYQFLSPRPVVRNVLFLSPVLGEVGFNMYSNTLPASVEIELATLEDRTLQRAATFPNGSAAQNNYLQQQAGKVHVFRQRVAIPNVDPAAYQ